VALALPFALLALILVRHVAALSRSRRRSGTPVSYPPLSEQGARLTRHVLSVAAAFVASGGILLELGPVLGIGASPGLLLVLLGCDLVALLLAARMQQGAPALPTPALPAPAVPAPGRPLDDAVTRAADEVVAGAEALLADAARQPPDGPAPR
jgi:hypothetical protein